MRTADQLDRSETIRFGTVATSHAQVDSAPHLDPAAYLSAFLLFQNALPDHVSADLAPTVAAAVQYHIDHPVAEATYEYMQAFVNLMNAHVVLHNVSLVAIDHMTPDVMAYVMAQLVAPIQPHGGF